MPTDRMDKLIIAEALRATEAGAIAAARLMGRGDRDGADQAAVTAMRKAMDEAELSGTIVIGEGERAPLSVMASDAYFPFPDGIQIAAQAGVTAIIQPGGSIRDEMAIEVADRHHMAMVFTGRRHFKH